jgi:MurNAc alpha-1-phosphate uridylyltransferase
MILAAGRGVRMRPLTDTTPKPLLPVGGRPLVVHLIERLRRAGFEDIVINVSHLGPLIESTLGDGAAFGVRIAYSREREALETAGGIAAALPLLGGRAFMAVNGDIYCEYEFESLREIGKKLSPDRLAHLVLTANPPHHPGGDFCLRDGVVALDGEPRLTFCGIGVYHPRLFSDIAPGERHSLAALLREPMGRGAIGGEQYSGLWLDIGTPERLARLEQHLAGR